MNLVKNTILILLLTSRRSNKYSKNSDVIHGLLINYNPCTNRFAKTKMLFFDKLLNIYCYLFIQLII